MTKIFFHDEELSSLTPVPERLSKALQMKVFLPNSKQPHVNVGKVRQWLLYLFQSGQLIGAGNQIEIQGNWANLKLDDADALGPVQSVHLEIIRRAFP